MRKQFWSALAAGFVLISTSVALTAAPLEYTISGSGSGIFDHHRFTEVAFTIRVGGEVSAFRPLDGGYVLDPLTTASIDLDGIGTFAFASSTRLGINTVDDIYFSRTGDGGEDLLDFHLTTHPDLLTSFGPLTSSYVYALGHFDAVPTSGGNLTLSTSSNVAFVSSAAVTPVPLPATWPLLGCGLAALGASAAFRRRIARV